MSLLRAAANRSNLAKESLLMPLIMPGVEHIHLPFIVASLVWYHNMA